MLASGASGVTRGPQAMLGPLAATVCRQKAELPDWRDIHAGLPRATPIMTIVHNGTSHQVAVQPGPDGKRLFLDRIKAIFNLEDDESIALTFGCKVPGTGQEVTLEGFDAFDAAVHCASLSAGQRQAKARSQAQAALESVDSSSSSGSSGASKDSSVLSSVRNFLRRGPSRSQSAHNLSS
ncbi:hypothetical protein N2152v2_000276 [Parachlorella kessleri]